MRRILVLTLISAVLVVFSTSTPAHASECPLYLKGPIVWGNPTPGPAAANNERVCSGAPHGKHKWTFTLSKVCIDKVGLSPSVAGTISFGRHIGEEPARGSQAIEWSPARLFSIAGRPPAQCLDSREDEKFTNEHRDVDVTAGKDGKIFVRVTFTKCIATGHDPQVDRAAWGLNYKKYQQLYAGDCKVDIGKLALREMP